MPNQYTKYKSAVDNAQPYDFRWKECSGKKPRKQKSFKARTKPVTPENGRSGKKHQITSTAVLLYTPSSGLRIDPFQSYPVNPNQAELTVLDYFLHALAPSAEHNVISIGKPKTPNADPHIKYLLPYVLQEVPLFDALLATCQAQIMLSVGLSAYSSEFFIHHRGRAMSGLRKQLEYDADTSAMLAVTMLITCDYLTGDLSAVAGHAKALERMLQLRGEMPRETVWDRFVKKGTEAYKSISYFATGSHADDHYRKHELDYLIDHLCKLEYPEQSSLVETHRSWSHLPRGFYNLISASLISTQLISLISAVNDIPQDTAISFTSTLKTVSPIQAALQRFLQHTKATHLERSLAAGLLVYTFQYPRMLAPNMFHDPPMQGVVSLLRASGHTPTESERDLMIWAHIVVEGFASCRANRLPGTKEIYLRALNQYDVMSDWSKLEAILEAFFSTPELLQNWRACHLKMLEIYRLDRAASRTPDAILLKSSGYPAIGSSAVCPFSTSSSLDSKARCPFSQSLMS